MLKIKQIYGLIAALAGKSDTSHGHVLSDAEVTGTLPVTKGGTGVNTMSSGRFIKTILDGAVVKMQDRTESDFKTDLKINNVDNFKQIRALSTEPTAGFVPTWNANGYELNEGYEVSDEIELDRAEQLATVGAIKAYIDAIVSAVNALTYVGVIDCSTNPNYPASTAGDLLVVSVAGKIGGASGANVSAGDWIICNTDSAAGDHATVGANFDIVAMGSAYVSCSDSPVTDENIPVFDGTTGSVIKDGGYKVSDFKTAFNYRRDVLEPEVDADTPLAISNAFNYAPHHVLAVQCFVNGLAIDYNAAEAYGNLPANTFGIDGTTLFLHLPYDLNAESEDDDFVTLVYHSV